MPRWRLFHSRVALAGEAGTASLEFVTSGMILLLPMVYLVLTMAAIQGASFAVEGAARQAVRVYVQAADIRDAEAQASRALEFALADYGVDPSVATLTIECSPRPADCLHRRGSVTISVAVSVPLPLMPGALGARGPLAVPLLSSATEQVSRFWGAR